MTSNKKGLFLSQIFSCFLLILVIFSCAVQQRPQGGPKDVDPPKLLKATPANSTRNFKAQEIRLDFDEYFKLNNQYSEISVFPAPEKNPDYKKHGKTLIIDLKDTLLKNTTYVINFGKAIGDVNENNIVKNFTYVFSTGNHIDSLTMSGTVTNNETGLKEKDATVMIFTLKQDSLLFGKKKPSLYTTTDSVGNFRITNLKEGVYKIYALKEKTPDKIYDADDELIAFSTRLINFTKDTSNIMLRLFRQTPAKFRVDRKFLTDGSMQFIFNKALTKPSIKIIYPDGLDAQKIVETSKTKDTLTVYSKNMDFDSVRFAIYDNNKIVDTTYLRKLRKESYTRNLTFRYGITLASQLKTGSDLKVYANMPIDNFEPALIALKEDSTVVKYTISKDTGAASKVLSIKYPWKAKASYQLVMQDAAVTDIYGDKSKQQTKKFNITPPDAYTNLAITVTVPVPGKSYVVELLDEHGVAIRSDIIKQKSVLSYRNIYVGKFTLRAVYDNNNNGKWDSGSIQENRQPESIWVYNKQFILRPNWDTEETVEIPKEVVLP